MVRLFFFQYPIVKTNVTRIERKILCFKVINLSFFKCICLCAETINCLSKGYWGFHYLFLPHILSFQIASIPYLHFMICSKQTWLWKKNPQRCWVWSYFILNLFFAVLYFIFWIKNFMNSYLYEIIDIWFCTCYCSVEYAVTTCYNFKRKFCQTNYNLLSKKIILEWYLVSLTFYSYL